jgi:hypothetical protein
MTCRMCRKASRERAWMRLPACCGLSTPAGGTPATGNGASRFTAVSGGGRAPGCAAPGACCPRGGCIMTIGSAPSAGARGAPPLQRGTSATVIPAFFDGKESLQLRTSAAYRAVLATSLLSYPSMHCMHQPVCMSTGIDSVMQGTSCRLATGPHNTTAQNKLTGQRG